ncbi:MAG TPA: CoA ester lyase [Solirubrobacterales bacterium]|jgi:citrate lyase subunit beta/citryl-CoA lyase
MESASLGAPPLRRRSCLSVPGSSQPKLEKAAAIAADELVFDLEDSVAIEQKIEARRAVAALIDSGALAGRAVAVRVNAVGTPWLEDDVEAIGRLAMRPLSVVLPKAERGEEIELVARLLDAAEGGPHAGGPIRLQALIETATGISEVGEIAAASRRLAALIIGYADLAASLGRSLQLARDPESWLSLQDAVLVAARGHGLQAIDGPWLGTSADDAFLRSARWARGLGFDGKWAIHPGQVGALNEVFLPDRSEVEWAERVLKALESSRGEGSGATALDGTMIDEALAATARRVLVRAKG